MKQTQLVATMMAGTMLAFLSSDVRAHFLWLVEQHDDGDQPKICLYFSETGESGDPDLLERINTPVVWRLTNDGRSKQLATTRGDDSFLVDTDQKVIGECFFVLTHDFGVIERGGQTFLLRYEAKVGPALGSALWDEVDCGKQLELDIVPSIDVPSIHAPGTDDGRLCLSVLWRNSPLEGATVKTIGPGAHQHEATTDASGKVFLDVAAPGRIAVRANHTEATPGSVDGQAYDDVRHYTTLTLDVPSLPLKTAMLKTETTVTALPNLPEPISSFGAAVHDGYLYVYGGHRGEAHAHSLDNLAPAFLRIALHAPADNPGEWESLPMETPAQGLALVSDGKYLYRLGGLTAHNTADEDDDLHSQSDFRRFDPHTNTWSALPSLPEPRSSHDAIVLDGKLYVIGGWQLAGEGHGRWHETAWVFDLAEENAAWQPLPAPPFQNRALAVAAWNGKVFALGGMTSDGEITRAVYAFDPKTNEWSEQATIPGDGMQGFGAGAWGHDTGLCIVGSDGHLYRLASDGGAWESIAQLDQARFFHRLLPLDARSLIAVGGASHEVGHLDDIERIVVNEQ